jgi:hypothetical protein
MKAATLATVMALGLGNTAALMAQIKPPPPAAPAPSAATTWVAAQAGALPPGAEPTGYEPGGFLYSCRAQIQGSGTHPGKVRPGFTGCYVPIGGRETSIRQYEVYVGALTWTVARDGTVPEGAVEGGRTASNQVLYVCRAAAAPGQLQPGKTGAGLRGCNVGVGGDEQTLAMYEVLVHGGSF